MSDPMDRIGNARDGFDRAAQRFERANARRTSASGSDASGQVSVRTSPDGSIEDIVIGNQWAHHIAVDALGASVLEAYTAAGIADINKWGEAVAEEVDGPEPVTRPLPPTSDSLAFQLGEIVSVETLARQSEVSLQAMADMLHEVVRDVGTVSDQVAAQARSTFVGAARGASVTVNGTGVLMAVELEPDWADRTPASAIAQYLMTAYADALRQSRVTSVDDIIASSSLGEFQRLSTDPHALAARLRLT